MKKNKKIKYNTFGERFFDFMGDHILKFKIGIFGLTLAAWATFFTLSALSVVSVTPFLIATPFVGLTLTIVLTEMFTEYGRNICWKISEALARKTYKRNVKIAEKNFEAKLKETTEKIEKDNEIQNNTNKLYKNKKQINSYNYLKTTKKQNDEIIK